MPGVLVAAGAAVWNGRAPTNSTGSSRSAAPSAAACYELTLDQEQINDFSYSLECAFQSLLDAIEEIDREVFAAECEQFIAAVWSDNVQPMDF